MLAEIKEIIKHNSKNYIRILKAKPNKKLLKFIYDKTPYLSEQHNLKTRLFWILNDIKDWSDNRVCCKVCGKPIIDFNVPNLNSHYKATCSLKCSRTLANSTNKQTCLNKYGCENPFQIKEVKENLKTRKDELENKKKQTRLKHFGNPNFNNVQKAKQTKLERYGSVWNLNKCKETWLEKYGVDNPMHNYDIFMKQSNVFYEYEGVKFDSSWELAFYIWLKDHKIDFKYHPDKPEFWYFDDKNLKHRYYPDFIVNNEVIEIKGNNAFDDNGYPLKNDYLDWSAKLQCMKDNNVKILMKADIQQYLDYISDKYGKSYLNSFKKL